VRSLPRRAVLGAAAAGAAAATVPSVAARAGTAPVFVRHETSPFPALDARILAGMKAHGVPGVAVGLLASGREYIRGYGVTNVQYPVPVDGDTVFRIGSNTKNFTGTAIMRLVEQGQVDLDSPVRRYLPDFAVSDPATSALVTVRQLLNHSSGWLGDDLQDFGPGDDAVAQYVASMTKLPQLTPVGTVFSYNNAGLVVAGRIIECVTGQVYEDAITKLLLDPLGLNHTKFFSDQIIGFNVAASHDDVNNKPVVNPAVWPVPRSINPAGGLISSARDLMGWARFHLGHGTTPDGTRLLSRQSLVDMRSNPGPGGTIIVELIGMGVTWMLRPTAQGVPVIQHGGNWIDQGSGFMFVPGRGFAMTMLTNSAGGASLVNEFFADDWALRRYAGLSNLPAVPRSLTPAQLAPFEGRYTAQNIGISGDWENIAIELRRQGGRLSATTTADGQTTKSGLVFYRPDYALNLDAAGQPTSTRSDFIREPGGQVSWLRTHGRIYRHQ
jgi:CubicO group peptidase (beta-lactamase class C family)